MSELFKRSPVIIWGVIIVAALVVMPSIGRYLWLLKGPVLVIGGLAAITWLHKRKFDVTNEYGVEIDPSFLAMLKRKSTEGVVFLLAFAACMVGAVFTLALLAGFRI